MGSKDTVWALYIRAILLWTACVRMRFNTITGDLDMSVFAMRAWMETEAIEEALKQHTCSVERAFFFHPRELLFKYVVLPFALLCAPRTGPADQTR